MKTNERHNQMDVAPLRPFGGVMYARKISLYFQTALLLVFSACLDAEESVPSPTKLELALELPDSSVTDEFELGEISTPKAKVKVSEVSVETSDGQELRGIKIYLSSGDGSCIFSGCTASGETDIIFLDSELISLILEELKEIGSRNLGGYFGIARCRPSQPVPQAYCLESYIVDEKDFGILIRTPRTWFKFIGVSPNDLGEIINGYGKSIDRGS